jgi:hypothetical protein
LPICPIGQIGNKAGIGILNSGVLLTPFRGSVAGLDIGIFGNLFFCIFAFSYFSAFSYFRNSLSYFLKKRPSPPPERVHRAKTLTLFLLTSKKPLC